MSDHVADSGAKRGPADPSPESAEFGESAEFETTPEAEAALRGVIDDYMNTFEPDPEDTAGVRERILALVREDLYHGPSTRLQTGTGHPFSITTASVRAIVRTAVDAVDGIRARSVDVTPAGDPEGSAATVALTVAMRAGISFASTAEVVRRSVAAAVAEELGIPTLRIDIDAEDVYVD